MKKVLISTIVDYNNYGNRLQNFALQETIKELGFDSESLRNEIYDTSTSSKINYFLKELSFKEKLNLLLKKFKPIKTDPQQINHEREDNFRDFTKTYITESSYLVRGRNFDSIPIDDYSFFFTGSDQVWNPEFRKGSPIDFLRFAPEEKRIAYAPSFGVSTISHKYTDVYSKWINEIPNLSVREESGAKLVKNLTNRDAEVLVDPTLLVSEERWLTIKKESRHKPKSKYLLTYFLGEVSEKQNKDIELIANKYNLEIVNLGNEQFSKYFAAGPDEFLDYIYSSEIFLTNSFHGVVFSIIFKKPFIIYKRGEMNSRINTLLNKFKLENRKIENIIFNDVFEISFDHTESILKDEKMKAINFLRKSMKIE